MLGIGDKSEDLKSHYETSFPVMTSLNTCQSKSESYVLAMEDTAYSGLMENEQIVKVQEDIEPVEEKEDNLEERTSPNSENNPRNDSSVNNCCQALVNVAIPCCQKRVCGTVKTCPPGEVCSCVDPCCCYPMVSGAFVDSVKLKQENLVLRNCIKRVRECAMSEACDIIKGVIDGYKCSCCKARTKLRPCKSVTTIPCRETWLCVPMAGSSRCGGYTPSGWGKMLKKCREITKDPCTPCDLSGRPAPCVKLRCKCLPKTHTCPPCPHLCPMRSLPSGLRPYTPCCPLYFPSAACSSAIITHTDTSGALYKYGPNGPCKPSAITEPPYKPKYTAMSTYCNGKPQPSASVPGTLPKMEGIYSPTRGSLSR